MALQTTGLKYTSQGVEQFISNVQKAAANLNTFTNSATASSKAIRSAATDLRLHSNALNAMVGSSRAIANATNTSNTSFARLGQSSSMLHGIFSKLGSSFSSIPKAIGSVASSAGSGIASLLGFGQAAQQSSLHLDHMIERVLLLTAVFGAIGVVKDWISTGYEQVILYDQLQSSLQALIAKEMVETGQSKNMGDAWDAATSKAQDLTNWVEKLGILSIFESQDIKDVMQMSMSVGILTDDAKALTVALVDWGSVTKATPEALKRVTNALTDVFTKGRVQGEEMRQLTRNQIPAWNYLADAMGVTTAKIREMVTQGLVPADVGIKAIVDGIEKDFGGAAAKMSTTLIGLTSSLKDLKKISLREVFAPAIEAAMPTLERLVTVLQTPEVKKTLNEWGAALGEVAVKALDFAEAMFASGDPIGFIALQIDKAIPGFFRFAESVKQLGSMFIDIAGQALSWGFNIGASLAEGVMQAATYIVQALSYIGSIIASWLAPGSPPKLLPELGEWGKGAGVEYIKGWSLVDKGTVNDSLSILGYNIFDSLDGVNPEAKGTETAELYLKGWSKADMGMFKDLEKSIRDVLGNMVSAGNLPKEGLIPALLGGEDVIKRAVQELDSFGKVTDDTMSLVDEWASSLSPDIREVVDSYIAWEEASIAVKDAQENLNQINKDFEAGIKAIKDAYDDTLGPLNASLKANEKQQKQLRDQEKLRKLQKTLGDSKSTDAEKRAAQLEIEEMGIRQQIDAVEERRDAEISAAEEQKKIAVDAATLALEEAKKQEDIAKTAYESKQAQIELQKEHNGLIAEQTKLLEAQAKAAAKAAGGGGPGGLPKPEKAMFGGGALGLDQGPIAALDEAMAGLNEKAAAARQHWADLRAEFETSKAKIIEFKDNAIAPLTPLAHGIGLAFGSIAAGGIITFVARLIGSITPIGLLITAGTLLYQAWSTNFMGIQKIADQLFGALTGGSGNVSDIWTNTLLPATQTVSAFFVDEVMPVFSELAVVIMPLVMAAGNLLASIFTNVVVPAAGLLWNIFKTVGIPMLGLLAGAFTFVFNVVADYILPVFGAFFNFVSEKILPIVDAHIKIITELARIVGEVLRLAFESIIFIIEGFIKKVEDAGKGVTILVDYLFGPGSMDYALDQVSDAFDYVVGLISDFTSGLSNLKGVIDSVVGWLKDLADTLSKIDIPSALDPGSPTPFEIGLRGITDALGGLMSAIALAPTAFGQLHGLTHDMLKNLDDISKKASDLVEQFQQGILESKISGLGNTISSFRFGNEMLYDLRSFNESIEDMRSNLIESSESIQGMRDEYAKLVAEGKMEEAGKLLVDIGAKEKDTRDLQEKIRISEEQAKKLAAVQDQFQKDTIANRYEYSELAKEDPENAKLLYDLKTKQAQDLADLDRKIILAKTDEERTNLIYERAFLVEQQGYEMDLFKRQAAERTKTMKDQITEIVKAWQDAWSQEGVFMEGFPEPLQKMFELISALMSLKLPDWLTPGSPTPLENALVGIIGAVQQLAGTQLPMLRAEFGRMSSPAGVGQIMNSVSTVYNNTNQYNLGVTTNRSPNMVMQSYEIMRSMSQ